MAHLLVKRASQRVRLAVVFLALKVTCGLERQDPDAVACLVLALLVGSGSGCDHCVATFIPFYFFSLISFWFISSKIPAGMPFNLLPVLMIILKPFREMIIR